MNGLRDTMKKLDAVIIERNNIEQRFKDNVIGRLQYLNKSLQNGDIEWDGLTKEELQEHIVALNKAIQALEQNSVITDNTFNELELVDAPDAPDAQEPDHPAQEPDVDHPAQEPGNRLFGWFRGGRRRTRRRRPRRRTFRK